MGNISYQEVEGLEVAADTRSPDLELMEKEEEGHKDSEMQSGFNAASEVTCFKGDYMVKHLFAFGDFCAKHPKEWNVLSTKMKEPELSLRKMAERCSISHVTVERRLEKIKECIHLKFPPMTGGFNK